MRRRYPTRPALTSATHPTNDSANHSPRQFDLPNARRGRGRAVADQKLAPALPLGAQLDPLAREAA